MSADRSDARTGPVLPQQRGVRDDARAEVLRRHARLTTAGRPIFCPPSRAEIEGRMPPGRGHGSDGQVIYATREAAEAAARELEALGAGSLRPHTCVRSRGDHYHLTADSAPGTGHLPLHLRIPQQRIPLSA